MDVDEVSGYRVIRLLGAGGMGRVFLVQHPRLPRHDALKLLDSGVSRNDDFRIRFQREADLLAQLSHPNIVTLYDRGVHDDQLWIAMEFVDGTDAGKLLKERGPLPLSLVISLIGGAGAALDYAWRKQRITHRDVKPDNILLSFDDGEPETVKLADFGIAKAAGDSPSLTSTGITVGTMTYISPEAIEGAELDHRSDLYSLGCSAFYLLTGQAPYPAATMAAMMSGHLNQPVPRITDVAPDLPRELNAVFATALAKNPDDRFDSGSDFAAALSAAADAGDRGDRSFTETVPAGTRSVRDQPPNNGTTPFHASSHTTSSPASPAPPAPPSSPTTSPSIPVPANADTFVQPPARKSRLTLALAVTAAVLAIGVAALAAVLIGAESGTPPGSVAGATVPSPTAAPRTSTSAPSAPSSAEAAAPESAEPVVPEPADVTATAIPAVPAPVEGAPCNPAVDHRSPDGALSCSGLDGVWRDMSYQSHPPVQWNSPCSEPGARARVEHTDAIVTCTAAPDGSYLWQQ